MRKLIIHIIGTGLSFYLTNLFIAGFTIHNTWQGLLIASVIFILINTLIKPIIKLLFLPINLLTLGLFHWLINVIVLYVFDLLYEGVTISAYQFNGYTSNLISLPSMYLSLFWVLVLSSFTISLFYSLYETIFSNS